MATEPVKPEGIAQVPEVIEAKEIKEPILVDGRGGYRPGAGRKPKLTQEAVRQYIRDYFGEDKIQNILDMMYKASIGKISVIDGRNEDGTPKFHEIPPDTGVGLRILELTGGKATQPIDHSGEISNPQIESVAEQTRIILEKLSEKK